MTTKIDPIDKCIVVCSDKLGYPDNLDLFNMDLTVDNYINLPTRHSGYTI